MAADEIAAGAVGTSEVADNTLTADDLATGSVGTDEVANNTLTSDDLATDSVNSDEIAANAVDTSEINNDAVTTDKLGTAGATDANKVYTTDGSGNPQLEDRTNFLPSTLTNGSILIGDGTNVATAQAVTGDVTISNTGVTDIAANAVGTAEVANNTLTADDLATDSVAADEIAAGAVGTSEVADNTLTADDLATDSVNSDEIAANAVNTSEIATDAVTTNEILDGTVAFIDIAEREVTMEIMPEFPNFTLEADGTNNRGTMESDHDAAQNTNYYKWSTRNTTAQDYDIVFKWIVPENFQSFSTTAPAPMVIDYKTTSTTSTENNITITLEDTAGSAVTLTGAANLVSTTADTWVSDANIAFTGGTFTAGESATIRINMVGQRVGATRNASHMGKIKLNYVAK